MTAYLPVITSPYQWAGLIGVFVYVTGYTLLQLGYIRGVGYIYPGMVIVAAAAMLVSLIKDFNLASAIIQIIYIALSMIGIGRFWIANRARNFSADELELRSAKLADLPSRSARTLFDNGHWIEAAEGAIITRQDDPVQNLVYVADGTVEAIVDGRLIGMVEPGSFIGEITAMSGAPATATTIVAKPVRMFSISAEKLRTLARKDAHLRSVLESAFSADTRDKLIRSNVGNGGNKGTGAGRSASDSSWL